MVITRLGKGVDQNGILGHAGIAATISALRRFQQLTAAHSITPTVVATSAVREAANGARFADLVRQEVGWEVRILSGDEEAAYSFRGAVQAMAGRLPEGPAAVVDIGGGSTEILVGTTGGSLLTGGSVPVGAVRMAERYLTSQPLAIGEREALEAAVKEKLQPLVAKARQANPRSLIAVGGTATTLAAIDLRMAEYDPELVTGYRLSENRLAELYAQLGKLSPEELGRLAGLQPGREDIITAGACILLTVCRLLEFGECAVSDGDLLFGVLSSLG
jgi:exopolyphosphatase/guanosine-5'-triphosphate,3'-diphosphate pyrophosphatase